MPAGLSPTRRLVQGVLVGMAGSALALLLWFCGWLETWENKSWDWRAALLARPGAGTDQIRLILLDQKSLDWAWKENGLTWPWPREVYGAILNYCRRSGAKAVAFDVLFSEPSKYGVEDDRAFGQAIQKFGRFAGSLFLGQTTGEPLVQGRSWPKSGLKIIAQNPGRTLAEVGGTSYSRAALPIPEVADNAAVLGNVHLEPDPDGIYRRAKLFDMFGQTVWPSLGLASYLASHPGARAVIDGRQLAIDKQSIALDRDGTVVLRYRGPTSIYPAYSAAAILQSEIRIEAGADLPEFEQNALKNKYVLFGFSAPGLYDLRPSPMGGLYPGVAIYATMLDNFLSNDFIHKTPPWLTMLLVILMCMAGGVLTSFLSGAGASVLVAMTFVSLPIPLSLGAYIQGWWLPFAVQETALVFTLSSSFTLNHLYEGQQKRFIKTAFGQYLSPALIEQLILQPEKLKLGGVRRELTIFFSDLQGFTSISEGMKPENLTAFLNEYLSAMTDIIHDEGGTVDKYEGDAIIAFWNAPIAEPEHALQAVRAALRCQEELARMRPGLREHIGKDVFMRIGINTGPVVVGNMGSRTRFDYTVLGDAVNLASRLEGINKQFRTFTLISNATWEQIRPAIVARKVGRVAVVGRAEPVTVYEPMTQPEYESRKENLRLFDAGLTLFAEGRFVPAREIFSNLQESDPVAAAYVEKCRSLIDCPPEDWRGVWVMTEK